MENPGAITYRENYLYKKEPTVNEITDRASTIIHEQAHMWFGNTVTMKWWDDLWLNESFADFVNYIILGDQYAEKNLSFPIANGWLMFNSRKGWGYRADQMKNTHPIATDVPDTDAADSIFDGISYSKGAATMRQLFALIGRDNFAKSMKKYFNRHCYSNTVQRNLLDCMQEVLSESYAGQEVGEHLNLQKFEEDWLKKAGCNTIKVRWNDEDHQSNKKLTLVQGSALPEFNTLRYHKLNIGQYSECGILLETLDVIMKNQEETVVHYTTDQKIFGVIPNINDLSFIKIMFDETTLQWIYNAISNVKDPLTRLLTWRALYEMVRDANELKSPQFAKIIFKHLPKEEESTVAEEIKGYLSRTIYSCLPEEFYEENMKLAFTMTIELIEKELKKENPDKDRLKELQADLPGYAKNHDDILIMKNWLEGNPIDCLKGMTPTLQQKWAIVTNVLGRKVGTPEEGKALREKVESEDTTDMKKEFGVM